MKKLGAVLVIVFFIVCVVLSFLANLWVAHEFCGNPEISAELSNLRNTLVYEEDTYVTQEDKLATQLENILKRCQ